jgi:hypothetical protein
MKRTLNERGAVLLVAIIGLIVAGTLVTALVSVTVADHREGRNTRTMGQAFAAAEDGLATTVGNWSGGTYNGLVVGDSLVQTGTTANGTGNYTNTIKRLNNELFIIDVLGNDANSGARQRVGAFVKLKLLDMDIQAALTTRGPTRVGGSAQIEGHDADPTGWTGCPADSDLAGIRLPDTSDLDLQGSCSDGSCIDGVPSVQPDPAVSDSTFFEYGDTDWDGLVSMANKSLPPGTYTGVGPTFDGVGACDRAAIRNWGDPLTPASTCGGYFPIMYSSGNVNISGGSGQGILLVEGDLSVQGGFEFFGIIIVKQSLKTTGTGGHFNGSVMAANVDLDQNTVLGNAIINYSGCAVQRALTAAGSGALLRSRGWLYSY